MALATRAAHPCHGNDFRNLGVVMSASLPSKNAMSSFGRMGWLDVLLPLLGVLLSLLLIPSGWNWN
jgi:hypothetical protein